MSTVKYNERTLQKAAHMMLSDPSKVWTSSKGKTFQILSPGRLNVKDGPDFMEMAVFMDGKVIVGDAEFHRNSSEWFAHGHDSDDNYRKVVLHIVMNHNSTKQFPFETLILDEKEIISSVRKLPSKADIDINSIDELQHYALIRLLRKSSEAQKELNRRDLDTAYEAVAAVFLKSFGQKTRRPVYNEGKLINMLKNIYGFPAYGFLKDLLNDKTISVPETMQFLLKQKMFVEGELLRREFILNCVLPLAICLANEENRISLFTWFWSTPALSKYGKLARRFENLPQDYLWQQQGMLEYIKEHDKRANLVSEAVKEYGFAEILSFYKLAGNPAEIYDYDTDFSYEPEQ